jgi:glycine/D-amino acid oxidase-like deaminating enzyme
MDSTHLVVGGGAYGCFIALRLAQLDDGHRVAIVERERDLLLRASYNNQARVHNGYHYPRSLITALRSRVNAPRFLTEFRDAIHTDFQQFYAIARERSHVTPHQFEEFCRRVGAELRRPPAKVTQLFNPELIEAVYAVTEYAFNADSLRDLMRERLQRAGVKTLTRMEARKISRRPGGLTLELRDLATGEDRSLDCRFLYNSTYSQLNRLLSRSELQTIRLRHEATEMTLIQPPEVLARLSITVMCGPFFSLMPFPARGLAALSHVSYTPHYSWTEDPPLRRDTLHEPAFPLRSNFDHMRRDAARYVPALGQAEYVSSLWEIKTVLPQSDANDSRPILFKRDHNTPNVISLLGSKIDNIFDLEDALKDMHTAEISASPA